MTAQHEAILSLTKDRVIRARELGPLGIGRYRLRELVDAGWLEKADRGLYRATDADISENRTLVEVASRCPKAVFCLITALRFHNLTSENPEGIYFLLPKGYHRPRMARPMLDVFWASGQSYSEGIEERVINGVTVRVTSPAKTVIDCFKYRTSVGIPLAVEALKEVWEKKLASADELWRLAQICRMTNLMRPYFDSIL